MRLVEDKTTVTLAYQSPLSKPPWSSKTKFKIACLTAFLSGIAFIFIGAASDQNHIFTFGIFLAFTSFFVPLIWSMLSGLRAMKSVRNSTEEEFDAEYQKHQELEAAELLMAKHIYTAGPIGLWRFAQVSYEYKSMPKVYEERELRFEKEGHGLYRWFRREDERGVFESHFDYHLEAEGLLQVRMLLPGKEGEWQKVEYYFEPRPQIDGDAELWICFESVNPLAAAMMEYWPFWGEFSRGEM